jgi:hypothetical protein
MNPGGTSDLWENNLISFRFLSSKYEGDRQIFCNTLKTNVLNILRNKFNDYDFDAEFTAEDYSSPDDGRYTVVFNISIANNDRSESAIVSGTISVDPKTNSINLKYDKSIDNITIA